MQIDIQSRDVFYVSDGTAITCETLGHVVLGQFPFKANEKTFPFVESEDKLSDLLKEIEISYRDTGLEPLVFFSIVIPDIKAKFLRHQLTVMTCWRVSFKRFRMIFRWHRFLSYSDHAV